MELFLLVNIMKSFRKSTVFGSARIRRKNVEMESSDTIPVQDTVLGKPYETLGSYDLMEVVIVNLGDADKESDLEILDLLNTLFSLSTSSETKKKRLQKDFGIAMTEEFESEVQDMCNLGKALVEQGIEQGVEKKNLSLAKMMIKDKESLDKIEKYTGFSADKLKEIAASIGTNLTA